MSAIQQLLASYGAFNPLTIPSLTEWFDYRTLASVGNGNPVSSWQGNKSVYTLTQTGTPRPTYVSNAGDGKAGVQFDSVNDFMSATVTNFGLYGSTGNYEAWTFVNQSAPGIGSSGWLASADYANNGVQMAANSSSLFIWSPTYPTDQTVVSTSLFDSSWHLIRFSKNGARRIVQIDGTTVFDSTTSAGTMVDGSNSVILGTWNGNFLLGYYRQALFFGDVLDSTTAAQLTTYLQSA